MSAAGFHDGMLLFVVDTEQYSGNFERQMVAYVTGQVGSGDIGRKDVDDTMPAALREWCDDHVGTILDDMGTERVAVIFPTPGWFSDGLSGRCHREGAEPDEVMAAYLEGVKRHVEAIRQVNWSPEVTPADVEEMVRRDLARYTTPGHHRAYLSVACRLTQVPPSEVYVALAARARDYCEAYGLTFTGTRLLRARVTFEDIHPET